MRSRALLAALVVAFGAGTASALDASVLNGKDDVEFAQALADAGYPDLAEQLIERIEASGAALTRDAAAALRAVCLSSAQREAARFDDPVRRKDALLAVLHDKEQFFEETDGTSACDEVRVTTPDLHALLADSFVAAIGAAKDEAARGALRGEGDALFRRLADAAATRVAGIRAGPESKRWRLDAAAWEAANARFLRRLLFQRGSKERIAACKEAAAALEELELEELEVEGEDSVLSLFAVVDAGVCYGELGSPSEALSTFDRAISVRENFVENGRYRLDEDVRDIVCSAVLEKMRLLAEQKTPAKAIAAGRDYLDKTVDALRAPSAMALAKELAEAQLATNDAAGAAATAMRMIDADPRGVGARWGREILDRAR